MRASSSWLIVAAEAAASQMPINPNTAAASGGNCGGDGGIPGAGSTRANSMPTNAVNTINATTRGLVSCQYWRAVAEIGRASCRERVCQYVWISVGAVYLKKKIYNIRTNALT